MAFFHRGMSENPEDDPFGVDLEDPLFLISVLLSVAGVFLHRSCRDRYSIVYFESTEGHSYRSCLVVF
jgi:hypothetical protein